MAFKALYPAGSQTITISPQGVASASTFLTGAQSDAISNISDLDLDHQISGIWTCGTTPTINTRAEIYVVCPYSDDLAGTEIWPDNFADSFQTVSVTSAGVLMALAKLAATINIDATTSDRTYPVAPFSVAALFGGFLPPQYVIYIAHNSVAAANNTAGNHVWKYQRVQAQ